ncbi:DUF3365 domain-containing protein [Thiohalocapsa sp. ML1]|jgi:hypothetical protein|uniref:Tll0287-like domain-containing protein n=1 Tax=Thiohalocapsa sp. ML1 TaxID=1431688 RepID=UPI000732371A|nr:DUF3365 domain-containing protein [Thiohalocapsa sp. ML1]
MNKPLLAGSALAIAAVLAATSLQVWSTTSTDAGAAEAREIITAFTTSLQGELKGALKEGGPVAAVTMCKDKAPAIAEDLSEEHGWDVGRTSLKPRNPANAPDAWEEQVLEQFASRQQNGESPMGMTYASVEETADGKVYRFMQAIPTAEVCLACHGTDIAEPIAAALDKAYPEDQARGYSAGEIRGAFTLSKPM